MLVFLFLAYFNDVVFNGLQCIYITSKICNALWDVFGEVIEYQKTLEVFVTSKICNALWDTFGEVQLLRFIVFLFTPRKPRFGVTFPLTSK